VPYAGSRTCRVHREVEDAGGSDRHSIGICILGENVAARVAVGELSIQPRLDIVTVGRVAIVVDPAELIEGVGRLITDERDERTARSSPLRAVRRRYRTRAERERTCRSSDEGGRVVVDHEARGLTLVLSQVLS